MNHDIPTVFFVVMGIILANYMREKNISFKIVVFIGMIGMAVATRGSICSCTVWQVAVSAVVSVLIQRKPQSEDIKEGIVDEEEESEVPPPPSSSVTIRRSAAARSTAIHIAPRKGEKYHLVKTCTGLRNASEVRTVTLCGTCGKSITGEPAGVVQAEPGSGEGQD